MIKKTLTLALLITFFAVGVLGFMFMIHNAGTMSADECPATAPLSDCPISTLAHIGVWRGIAFDFSQIIIFVVLLIVAFGLSPKVPPDRSIIRHRTFEWISRFNGRLQLLHQILFKRGILNPKIPLVVA